MDNHASSVRRALTAATTGLVLVVAGCKAFQKPAQTSDGKSSTTATAAMAKPGIPAASLTASWSRTVEVGTDPNHHTPMPAIVGRAYFFDAKLRPVEADGKLTVELFDDTNRRIGKPSVKLEEWNINSEQLAKMVNKDPLIGTGYSLILPWPSFKSDVGQIHMVIHYTPKSGQALTMSDQIMTLEQSTDLINTQQSAAQPTGAVPASAHN